MHINTDLRTKPSAKSVYLWNIIGSMSNALASILFLMLITRTLGAAEGDVFSLAWAVSQLMLTIGTFQVRLFQSTDVNESYKFKQYLFFRFITIVAMNVAAVVYVLMKGYDSYKTAIIFILLCVRTFDALADVYQGWFQQKERLDLAGKGLALKVIFAVSVFGALLITTQNLLAGCIGMLSAYAAGFFIFEFRYAKFAFVKQAKLKREDIRPIFSLFVKCLPLFLNAYLIMSIFNAPKMAIDTNISNGILPQGEQTKYGILFMPASVINLAFIVFRPMITQMAIYFQNKDMAAYKKTVRKIMLYLGCFTVVVLVGGWLLGIPILSFIYSVDLKGYTLSLLILLLGGALNTFLYVLDNALTVIRKQHALMAAYIITWIYSTLATPLLVSKLGIVGASLSFLTSMEVLYLGTLVLYQYYVKKLAIKRS